MRCYLENRGWKILVVDARCAGVQVDLLARSPRGILTVVEVKSSSHAGLQGLSWRQKRRLFRVANVLAQCEPVQLVLAYCDRGVRLLPLDGLTA